MIMTMKDNVKMRFTLKYFINNHPVPIFQYNSFLSYPPTHHSLPSQQHGRAVRMEVTLERKSRVVLLNQHRVRGYSGNIRDEAAECKSWDNSVSLSVMEEGGFTITWHILACAPLHECNKNPTGRRVHHLKSEHPFERGLLIKCTPSYRIFQVLERGFYSFTSLFTVLY